MPCLRALSCAQDDRESAKTQHSRRELLLESANLPRRYPRSQHGKLECESRPVKVVEGHAPMDGRLYGKVELRVHLVSQEEDGRAEAAGGSLFEDVGELRT